MWDFQTIIFQLTNQCPNSCPHCFLPKGKKMLSLDQMEAAISFFEPRDKWDPVLTGGEPLLNPYFFEILDLLERHSDRVTILTSGHALTINHVIALGQKFRHVIFLIPFDSADDEIHDQIKGRRGAFKESMDAISLIQNAGFPNISCVFKVLIRTSTIEEMSRMLTLARNIGCDGIFFSCVIPVSGEINRQSFKHYLEEVNQLIWQFSSDILFFVGCHEPLRQNKKGQTGHCPAGINSIYVSANGSVTPCPFFLHEIIPLKDGARLAFNNNPLIKFLRQQDGIGCRRFPKQGVSCAGCLTRKHLLGGDFKKCDPYCPKQTL